MKKILLILFLPPLLSKAQSLKELVPSDTKVYFIIPAADSKIIDFTKKEFSAKHLYDLTNQDRATIIIKFNIISTGLQRFSGYADFIDKKTQNILFTTRSVNNFFSTSKPNTGFFNYREGIIHKLINRRIFPAYK